MTKNKAARVALTALVVITVGCGVYFAGPFTAVFILLACFVCFATAPTIDDALKVYQAALGRLRRS